MIGEKENLLKEKLRNIIFEISHIKDLKQEVGKEFLNRNMSPYQAIALFTNPDYIYTLNSGNENTRFLFIFSVGLNNAMNEEIIKLDDYFTQIECIQYSNFQEEEKKLESAHSPTFRDSHQLTDRIWQGTITAQRLAKLEANNLLLYNFLTQRAPKITLGGIRIDFDKAKVKEIKERMLSGDQFPNHILITLNLTFCEITEKK